MTLRLIPYLVMDGNAKEAIQFYEKALDAQVLFSQSFGEMPENPEFPIPKGTKDRISHATLKIGETELMLSDTFPGQPHQSGTQVTICITTNEKEKATKFYEALQEGGQVGMPLQETFFSPAYGSVTDKFGVNFQIFTEGEQMNF
ncbi:VOC family protein [Heyndrickxia sp. NPDC080065]|uniref:VOC family protein n=1 Tax=Heyndrickxia sp. NPDC080065 TaxID=3390568 RepID=UPI003D05D10B